MQTGAIVLAWDYEQVVEIYKRHNFLKDRALEIFFADGQTYLIAFETYEVTVTLFLLNCKVFFK